MNQLNVTWTKTGITFAIGAVDFLFLKINDRMDYGGKRRRARNTAVEIRTHPFFSSYLSDSYKQMPWKEVIPVLQSLGATKEEVSRFVHMGYEIGWGDIEEVMMHNGQSTMF